MVIQTLSSHLMVSKMGLRGREMMANVVRMNYITKSDFPSYVEAGGVTMDDSE